jgi:hypothetical protein
MVIFCKGRRASDICKEFYINARHDLEDNVTLDFGGDEFTDDHYSLILVIKLNKKYKDIILQNLEIKNNELKKNLLRHRVKFIGLKEL